MAQRNLGSKIPSERENDIDDKLQEALKQDTEARAAESMSRIY